MQQATGQMARNAEFSRVRKDIARLKTVMTELERKGEGK
jgi:ribosomal protein L29